MKFLSELRYQFNGTPITHHDGLLLLGSCFTANVGSALADRLFRVSYNPTGILFDPSAIARHLQYLAAGRPFETTELFELDGLWHHWDYHSDFSALTAHDAAAQINAGITAGRQALQQSNWLVLTLGSAFRYERIDTGLPVANNHRAPAAGFRKVLQRVEDMEAELRLAIAAVRHMQPDLQVMLTVSPVRHHRDGLIENNRSKGRLLELVHRLCENDPACHYFPAYEMVTDVLRDYRWYDLDLVHPNHAATQYVFEQFCAHCMPESTRELAEKAHQWVLGERHRPRFEESAAHQAFLKRQEVLRRELATNHTELDWGLFPKFK